MAKTRMINTRFWNDGYIAELPPIEKLLFLYFLTNSWTNISGVYELPLKNVSMDTGIELKEIEKSLIKFSKDGKIEHIDGWVVIKNFVKHQNQRSPQVLKGIKAEIDELPEKLRGYVYGIETLSHLNLNLNSNLNLDGGEESPTPPPVFERKIREKEEEYRVLVKDLAAHDYLSGTKINQIVLDEFLPHWLERSEGAKKARFEKEKAFEYQRRIRTWVTNFHKYAKDWKCASDMWHRKGETCHCVRQETEIDYKKLPISSFAMKLGAEKRV